MSKHEERKKEILLCSISLSSVPAVRTLASEGEELHGGAGGGPSQLARRSAEWGARWGLACGGACQSHGRGA
jgi:hypothetical protein